jgi:hypothetical protein
MPFGDFFWNACNTYRAFSNFTVYHCPEGVAPVIFDDLKNSRALAFPRLCLGMLPAKLRDAESNAHFVLHASGKSSRSFLADPIQNSGFSPGDLVDRDIYTIPVLGYPVNDFRFDVLHIRMCQ